MNNAVALFAAAAFGFAAAAGAQEGTLQKIKSSGSITIGQDGDRVSGHQAEIVHNGKTELLK